MNYLQVVQLYVRTPGGQYSTGANTSQPMEALMQEHSIWLQEFMSNQHQIDYNQGIN
jgi:hypothetical protein